MDDLGLHLKDHTFTAPPSILVTPAPVAAYNTLKQHKLFSLTLGN